MKLLTLINNFRNDESGAVTVDWVVLTAAIVGLGIAVISTVGGGVQSMGRSIKAALSSGTVSLSGLNGSTAKTP